jgi:FkbM family methyltransferase
MRYLGDIVQRHDVAIDVGASAGFYSYVMSKHFREVYSFEVNDEMTSNLVAYNPGNIRIIHKGLSSAAGEATLYVPVRGELELTGWASLTPGNCPDTQVHREKTVELCVLDDFNLERVSLVKIDVEGHEVEVLKGSARTIEQNRPPIIIEVQDKTIGQVSAFFSKLDYSKRSLQDLVGVSGSAQNCIFVPNELLIGA